jgi:hypothetical protein
LAGQLLLSPAGVYGGVRGAAAVLVYELDAGQLKRPFKHRKGRLKGSPDAKWRGAYHSFSVALAVLLRTAFAAIVVFDALAGATECAAATLLRRTPG